MDALAMTTGAALAHPALSGTEIKKWASVFVQSGLFKDTRDIAQAMVKIQAGQELGLPPMAAMRGFDVVDGRVAPNAGLTAALIKASGRYRFQVEHSDMERCVLSWYEAGEPLGESSFTMEEAKQAQLATKKNWQRYPSDMLFNRALTRGARRFCADLFLGSTYVPEELGYDELDDDDPGVGGPDNAEQVVDEVTGEIAEDHEERVPITPPADDEPEHWSPLIDEAREAGDFDGLRKLLGQIIRSDISYRRFGAMKACATAMGGCGDATQIEQALADIESIPTKSDHRQGTGALVPILREALEVLYESAAAEPVPA